MCNSSDGERKHLVRWETKNPVGWIVTLEEAIEMDNAEGNTGKVARKEGYVLDSEGKDKDSDWADIPYWNRDDVCRSLEQEKVHRESGKKTMEKRLANCVSYSQSCWHGKSH